MAKLMNAVLYDKYGGGAAALKHVEVPIPSPKKDEVLLKVEAASLNPMDWKIQKGIARPFLPSKFPFIPGTDVAGEVIEVGSAVTNFKVGDKVVAYTGGAGGGLAEYAATKPSVMVRIPQGISAAEAAGLPVAGLTALEMLRTAGIKLDKSEPRSNILITAAAGGVGLYAVQLAKLGNTHVTATCGSRNMELVEGLGADEVLDYKTAEGAALTSPSGVKYDVVLHCTGTGLPWSIFEQNLSERGVVIDITPGPKAFWTYAVKKVTCSKKKFIPMILTPKAENLEEVVSLMKEGKIKTLIDSQHCLNKAEDGWGRCLDGHATGKIIIEP